MTNLSDVSVRSNKELLEEMRVLHAERDNARKDNEGLALKVMDLERERDEAREAAREILNSAFARYDDRDPRWRRFAKKFPWLISEDCAKGAT